MEFDFEKLHVYQKALDFADQVFTICDKLPINVQSSLGDQLRRASLSITNNLAEGSGQSSFRKKQCFYEIALNSCRESVPVLALFERRELVSQEEATVLKECCFEMCKMMRGLIRAAK